jgi:hypothetical protein
MKAWVEMGDLLQLWQGVHGWKDLFKLNKPVTSKFVEHVSGTRTHIMFHVRNFCCLNPSVA